MLAKKRTLMLNILWLFVPSVIWSAVFHSFAICLDPLILQALERCLPRGGQLALRFAWVLLFIIPLLFIWNIAPGTYVFFLREALPFSPPSVLISVALAFVLLSWFVVYKGFDQTGMWVHRLLLTAGVLILLLKFALIAVAGNANMAQKRLKSPAITAVGMWYEAAFVRTRPSDVAGTPEVSFNTFARANTLPRKVVLMVVESWGETPPGLAQILAEMQSNRLAVLMSGFTVYRGSTLSGEFRELCSRYIAPTDGLMDGKDSFDCAPEFLRQRGYRTLGIHGYDGAFYARRTFWERFGLAERWFSDEMKGSEQCPGPFQAACDETIIERGVHWLEADETRRFLYLLTLSSHEPVAAAALIRPSGKFFKEIQVLHPTQQIARRALSSFIEELERAHHGQCVLAYVVGDHAPPSAAPKMFPDNQVPFIAFQFDCPG